MPFTTRNCYYLRISKSTVLPIYVYLDERHVNWMSDVVLQHVLSDLRPKVLPKLKAEAELIIAGGSTKKPTTVDTHRGETYQFCYFLRKTEPHSVVVKSRTFSAAPQNIIRNQEVLKRSAVKKGKRKAPISEPDPAKKKRTKTKKPIVIDSDGDEDVVMDNGDYLPPGRGDDEEHDSFGLEIEAEESKPKPILGLKHQGFSIYGNCLCVVIEPWPVVRTMAAASANIFAKSSNRSVNQTTLEGDGFKQPLFLPEGEEDDSEVTEETNPKISRYMNRSYLKQVLDEVIELSDDSDKEDGTGSNGGMMEFTQVLQNAGDIRAGAMNDDADMDGSIFFGDADEYKEL